MARTVHKWVVPVDDEQHELVLPSGAEIVHVACQHQVDAVTFWAVVRRTSRHHDRRTFTVTGTGHPVATGWRYQGTALASGLVWHLWEVPS